jgi:hypothetical protein
MAKGHKTGGRVAGTPNRKTQEVTELLESLGCSPIEGMARIAMNEAHPPELRGRMYAELAQYVAPKRKSVEMSAADGYAAEYSIAEELRAARQARQARELEGRASKRPDSVPPDAPGWVS